MKTLQHSMFASILFVVTCAVINPGTTLASDWNDPIDITPQPVWDEPVEVPLPPVWDDRRPITPLFRGLGPATHASGMSADGKKVGGLLFDNETTFVYAFRWSTSGSVEKLLLHQPIPMVYGISNNGLYIIGDYIESEKSRGFLWSPTTGGFATPPLLESRCAAISDVATVVGNGSHDGDIDNWRPFVWSVASGSLHYLPGDQGYEPEDVSADGSVIVGSKYSDQGDLALRWIWANGSASLYVLPDLPGGATECKANAVSADGSVAVGYASGPAGREAVRWIDWSPPFSMGVPDHASSSSATSISPDGSIIAGSAFSTLAGASRAVVWDFAKGIRWLSHVLENHGLQGAMAAWVLKDVTGVTTDASFVYFTGNGTDPHGKPAAWWARVLKPLK